MIVSAILVTHNHGIQLQPMLIKEGSTSGDSEDLQKVQIFIVNQFELQSHILTGELSI